jgi:hypothetical protein
MQNAPGALSKRKGKTMKKNDAVSPLDALLAPAVRPYEEIAIGGRGAFLVQGLMAQEYIEFQNSLSKDFTQTEYGARMICASLVHPDTKKRILADADWEKVAAAWSGKEFQQAVSVCLKLNGLQQRGPEGN